METDYLITLAKDFEEHFDEKSEIESIVKEFILDNNLVKIIRVIKQFEPKDLKITIDASESSNQDKLLALCDYLSRRFSDIFYFKITGPVQLKTESPHIFSNKNITFI